jgi:hypothetical protein
MKWWLLFHAVVVVIILLVAFSPLISVVIAGSIANAHGCTLDEGSVHPCIVNGTDMGETLYTMGVMGWLMLATIPIGLVVVGVYLVLVLVIYLVRRYRAQNRAGVKETDALDAGVGSA